MAPHDTPRTLFVVSFDWRDIFRTGRTEYYEKLQRDQLRPDINSFFFFSWARMSYTAREGNWETVHLRSWGLEHVRPLLNLWALFMIPYVVWRSNVRPDAWLVYDFGMVPAVWLAHQLYGGRLLMLLNNQPRMLSATRPWGRLRGWYAALTERMTVGLVEHFFTLNDTNRTYLTALGVPHDAVSLYTVNTIERDSVHIARAERGRIRAQYALPPHAKILLTVARLEAEKDYARLLTLFATLPDTHVLFCLGEGSLRQEIETQVEKLHLGGRVFLPGNIQRADIWDYYQDADAFVLLSKSEALGIVFWEAMYLGVPVIGADIPGIVESLGNDGERGRLCATTEEAKSFVEKVAFCVEPSAERTRMIERAKTFVDHKLENHATINDFLDSVSTA